MRHHVQSWTSNVTPKKSRALSSYSRNIKRFLDFILISWRVRLSFVFQNLFAVAFSEFQIIWGLILRWFRFWSQKNISAYAFKRKSRLKKFAWADPKNFHWFESVVKFLFEINPYVMKLKITTTRIAGGQKIEHVRYL